MFALEKGRSIVSAILSPFVTLSRRCHSISQYSFLFLCMSCYYNCPFLYSSLFFFFGLFPTPTSPYTTLDYFKDSLFPPLFHLCIPMRFSTVCLALAIFTVAVVAQEIPATEEWIEGVKLFRRLEQQRQSKQRHHHHRQTRQHRNQILDINNKNKPRL